VGVCIGGVEVGGVWPRYCACKWGGIAGIGLGETACDIDVEIVLGGDAKESEELTPVPYSANVC
jgi:hypothetical protein